MNTPQVKRRWYQFSQKTMLVVVTLFCLGPASWVAFQRRTAEKQREALEAIGATVNFDPFASERAEFLRAFLGNEKFGNVTDVWLLNPQSKATNADLCHLARLNKLGKLLLDSETVTDEGLAHIAGLSQMEYLHLDCPQMTDTGLKHIVQLKKLKFLELDRTQVTEAGIARLKAELPRCLVDLRHTKE